MIENHLKRQINEVEKLLRVLKSNEHLSNRDLFYIDKLIRHYKKNIMVLTHKSELEIMLECPEEVLEDMRNDRKMGRVR